MFLLIPLIIIFLLLSYIYLNEVNPFTEGVIYSVCIFTASISVYIYIKIKKDIEQHEINLLEAELRALEKEFEKTEDDKDRNTLYRKIDSLKSEINAQSQQ